MTKNYLTTNPKQPVKKTPNTKNTGTVKKNLPNKNYQTSDLGSKKETV